jgi:hypothetical protein
MKDLDYLALANRDKSPLDIVYHFQMGSQSIVSGSQYYD